MHNDSRAHQDSGIGKDSRTCEESGMHRKKGCTNTQTQRLVGSPDTETQRPIGPQRQADTDCRASGYAEIQVPSRTRMTRH